MVHFLYTLIIYPLIQVIEFAFFLFESVFKNPGIAVIGVSAAVSVLCLPLYIVAERWQQLERDTQKRLAPGMAHIKAAFSGDEQYMMLSTYYRENHYHPLMALRSSFGLLIQIPFFIAAYTFLSHLTTLKGASFFFIRDMGSPDALLHIGSFPINVLPIAMTLINITASAIYTKGFAIKEKLQIYGMALVFLVLLYASPAGLVLYWTMNNVFSLIKNIFYKIKHPIALLYTLCALCIIGADWFLLFKHTGPWQKRLALAAVLTLLLFTPLIVKGIRYLLDTALQPIVADKKTRFLLFLLSACALCLLAGYVIPSYVINSSAVEFADVDQYGNPLIFLFETSLQMIGLCVFWPLCIYLLFHERIQTIIALVMPIALLVGLVNTFCFSGNYGTISRLMAFAASIPPVGKPLLALNLLAMCVCITLPVIIMWAKCPKILTGLVTIVLMTECAIGIVHTVTINGAYRSYKKETAQTLKETTAVVPVFHLSKTGRNVIVFMLDRAENAYVTPIFDAYPELYDIYDGFMLYKNTISYSESTLLGVPPIFGGYEYTPVEMNRRSSEQNVDKHNEALLVLPRIFTEQADFEATCSDLSWANYRWISDMSICDPYPNITGLNLQQKYTAAYIRENPDSVQTGITSYIIKRNLGWFSVFKMLPLFLRDSVYDTGNWCSANELQTDTMIFLNYYSVLHFLPRLTDFSAQKNVYCTITNDTTHENVSLQPPDYIPAAHITAKGPEPIAHYGGIDGNIAALKLIGTWLEYLKAHDCYDNTRIIMVADHGIGSGDGQLLDFPADWPMQHNPDHNHPLLLVKDFNATGPLTVNTDFMTNADVPALALKDIIAEPVNPFSGNPIATIPPEQKKASGIFITYNWSPDSNPPNTFRIPDEDWYTVSGNMFDAANWQHGIH
ncbi:MAG: YidC/Oxa1 family membrane protein insertase [Treponema sp.]|nr:YidC/Oxa1 family membrane protein insertase [Treponema sp.]